MKASNGPQTKEVTSMMLKIIPKALARISLCLALVLSGLMVCIHVPFVTESLSRQTSESAQFDVAPDTMVKASLATRDFALGTIGSEGLNSTLESLGLPDGALDASMLTHLQDCTWVFNAATYTFIVIALIALALLIATGATLGAEDVSAILWQSALLAILVIVIFAFWLIANFGSLFTWLHSLVFQAGTWTFSADSLLISMYPEQFWKEMGIVWGGSSIIFSVIAIIVAKGAAGH